MNELQAVEEILCDEYAQTGLCPVCGHDRMNERITPFKIVCMDCMFILDKGAYLRLLHSVPYLDDDDIPF